MKIRKSKIENERKIVQYIRINEKTFVKYSKDKVIGNKRKDDLGMGMVI